MNRNYSRGRRAEYRAMKMLRHQGYIAMRAAGSHGMFDVVALYSGWCSRPEHQELPLARFIQIKQGRGMSSRERPRMELQLVPPLCSKELWTFWPGNTQPTIEEIQWPDG